MHTHLDVAASGFPQAYLDSREPVPRSALAGLALAVWVLGIAPRVSVVDPEVYARPTPSRGGSVVPDRR